MGSNTSVLHASYAVAPTVTMPATDPMTGPGLSATQHLQEAVLAIQTAQIIAAGGADPEDPYGMPVVDVDPDDPVGTYDAFCTAIAEAKQHLAAMKDTDLADGELVALHDELVLKSHNYLAGLSVEDLQQIAATKGFQHPELAGSDLYGQHPLAHWLDPSCDSDLVSKAKVQAKALQRYNTQESNSPEALASPSVDVEGTWQTTAEEMLAAGSEVIDLANHYQQLVATGEESPEALAELIAAENKVATGVCPEGAGLDVAQLRGTVRGQVDQALAGSQLPGWHELAEAEQKAGNLTMDEALLLSPTQTVALLRANTPPAERTAVKATADLRGAQTESMWAAQDTLIKLTNGTNDGLAIPAQGEELQDFLDTAGTHAYSRAAVLEWKDQVPGWAPITLTSTEALVGQPLESWVKQQKLPALRKAAAETDMEGGNSASRAAIKDWIAASWTQTSAPATPATSGHQPGSLPGPAQQPASKATKLTSPPSPGGAADGFVAKHRELVSALQQAKATAADLPVRHDPGVVAGWSFGPGKTAALGGMHTKTVHTAPDGSAWMFKPDKTSHGARAHAEAAASAAFHAAGVPSVPVYVKNVGSKTGSIQPLISNAHPLPDSPADWSQADVDAIVRFHVASWMVGDHDGKSDNVLRTPSGGLVPIDQGQAFKFYGADKLAIDYHPNASYGAERPVFQQAYEAHVAGTLGKGVAINPAVAHPVIKAFEAIPDAQWRALLYDTAHEGANHDVAWAPTMRKRAAKKLGIPAKEVTPAQIADAFLDHAVERKHGLRSAFTKLFSGTLKLPGGAALKDSK